MTYEERNAIMSKVTIAQLEQMKHALGFEQSHIYHGEIYPYRNFFNVGEARRLIAWDCLVTLELAIYSAGSYHVTEKGKELVAYIMGVNFSAMDNRCDVDLEGLAFHLRDMDEIKEWLDDSGYDGLFNPVGDCACELSDLAPCSEPSEWCTAGYKHVLVAGNIDAGEHAICPDCDKRCCQYEFDVDDFIICREEKHNVRVD